MRPTQKAAKYFPEKELEVEHGVSSVNVHLEFTALGQAGTGSRGYEVKRIFSA